MFASIVHQSRENSALRLTYAFLAAMAALVVGSLVLQGWDVALRKEHGGVELASFFTALFSAAMALVLQATSKRGTMAVPLVLALFALRELDFHDWWFEPGLLHLEIFSGDAPLWQKAVSALVMAGILGTLITLVVRGVRPFWRALIASDGWPWLVIAGCGFVALSLVLDGLPARMDGALPRATVILAAITEECGEFLLFVCLAIAVPVGLNRPAH